MVGALALALPSVLPSSWALLWVRVLLWAWALLWAPLSYVSLVFQVQAGAVQAVQAQAVQAQAVQLSLIHI